MIFGETIFQVRTSNNNLNNKCKELMIFLQGIAAVLFISVRLLLSEYPYIFEIKHVNDSSF